ncbi:4-hydroxythreonine-4-phosphate dehydrogenase PdxA [bacterium]|nr:4-hydroxythreonine-4-phosphate dehydrogenase PdxA [bacterium]
MEPGANSGTGSPVLALSAGDARGIGPEVLLKAVAALSGEDLFRPLAVGCRAVLERVAAELWPGGAGCPEPVASLIGATLEVAAPAELAALEAAGPEWRAWLRARPELSGAWAGRAVEKAAHLALDGTAAAIATAPLDKSALNAGGYHYPGHTELLAHLAGDCEVSMMLAGAGLRVVPATTHIALARVPGAITQNLILSQCRIIDSALRFLFGIASPRLAVCGLNPHLGDSGVAGDEDQRVTIPAAEAARVEGLGVAGPFPADTVFVRAARGEFDAVLAMYHDQAMIAIKMHAFGRGVNITLGLPFVRTSPDHGTALDIAGRGTADSSSMQEALRLAALLGRNRAARSAG